MSAPHDPWKDARQWAEQGLRNARVIASTKTGQERIGWLEDVQYWQSLVDALVSQAETIRQGAAEIATLRATVAADDERLRAAGALVGVEFGCDTADWMAERILELRSTVDQQQARITALETDLMNQIDNSVALAHTVQAREARITELETALKDLLIAVTFAHTVEFTPENHCWEARVPVAFVEQARQALETP